MAAARTMPRTKSRRGVLSADRVVAAAIGIADAEGVDAVTMRRLAEVLEVHPTSIYGHLASKEAILDAVIEALLAEADLPTDADDWQTWVRNIAASTRRIARAHPGAFMVFTRRPASGPVARQSTETALAAFRRAGCTVHLASHAVSGCTLAILGLALNESPPTEDWVAATDLATLDGYPNLSEARVVDFASDEVWDLTISALIDGLQLRIGAAPDRGRAGARRARRRSG